MIPGKLKLSTITDPYSGEEDFLRIASTRLSVLTANLKKMFPRNLSPGKGFQFLETASPVHSVS